jgi:hypothetical protein
MLLLCHTLCNSLHNELTLLSLLPSPFHWWLLPTADVPFPLGFCTVLVLQSRQLLAHSHTTTTFSRRPTHYWISLRHSRRLSLHKFNSVKSVKVILCPIVSWPVCPGVKPPSGVRDQFFFSFFLKLSLDTCGFVIVGCPLWQKDGCVIYNCCWASLVQSFLAWVQRDSWQNFIVQIWDSPNL